MNTLNQVIEVIKQLTTHAAYIGVTLASLIAAVVTIKIMLQNDDSPTTRGSRWERLHKTLLCAGILAIIGVIVQTVTSIFSMIHFVA